MIRQVKHSDAKPICDIYNYYIANSICTFETELVSVSEMQKRIEDCIGNYSWIVFEENNKILGYAYVKKWHQRFAYRFTLESSVYVSHNSETKGIGSALYSSLFSLLEKTDCRSVLALIALPNESSIKLHEKFGFKKNGHLNRVGLKFNKWIDVGFWQKTIEHRIYPPKHRCFGNVGGTIEYLIN